MDIYIAEQRSKYEKCQKNIANNNSCLCDH